MKKRLLLFFGCLLVVMLSLAISSFAEDLSGDVDALNKIFTYKGFSYNKESSLVIGYTINSDALESYKTMSGKEIELGVVFSPYDELGGSSPLDSNGTPVKLESGKVMKATLDGTKNASCELIIKDIPKEQFSTKLIASAYIYDGENIYYVQENGVSQEVKGVSFDDAFPVMTANGISYRLLGDELCVTGISADLVKKKEIVIPYSYNGYRVTSIEENAFVHFGTAYNYTVGSGSEFLIILLPTSIEKIGDGAFSNCYNISLRLIDEDGSVLPYEDAYAWTQDVQLGEGKENKHAMDCILFVRPAIGWSKFN